MKGFLFALLLGAAAGYTWGYKDASAGRPSITKRAVNHFGVEKVRTASDGREEALRRAQGNRAVDD
jgi:hypothetical protein